MKLSDLKISNPAKRALLMVGIDTVEKCSEYTKNELHSLHGVGPKALRIIESELVSQNLSYKK